MIDQEPTYDVLIIGSGLGGLVSAVILAKEGKRVCVLEKNNQFGGNLQTFSRDKKIFDTGVHYIGGLSEGQNLNRYFSYLGIMSELSVERMPEVFDTIYFEHTKTCYPVAQGYDAFIKHLSPFFVGKAAVLERYVQDLKSICAAFPLYSLADGEGYSNQVMSLSVKAYFQQLTDDQDLQAVLAGTNFLYAGQEDKTPFYVHALTVNSYLQSAYRCNRGGSQIAKLLVKELRRYGGQLHKRMEVNKINVVQGRANGVETKQGNTFSAGLIISNIDTKASLAMIGKEHFRPAYFNRIQQLEATTSAFSLHVVLCPRSVHYIPHNIYGHKDACSVWNAAIYSALDWPSMFMVSMTEDSKNKGFADTLTILTYMHFHEVQPWEKTYNTVSQIGSRGPKYQDFKNKKERILLNAVSPLVPGLKSGVASIYSSTPLSYRDYIGMYKGNLYGHVKDAQDPLKTFIAPRSKIDNFFFTGHGTAMHGILGVTIGAVATCSEILGQTYLLNKIRTESDVSE